MQSPLRSGPQHSAQAISLNGYHIHQADVHKKEQDALRRCERAAAG